MAYVVNPYNFVPLSNAPTRTAVDAYYTGKLLTGRLDYTLTTDTPLLIPDTAKAVRDEKIDHKCYPFFRLPGGTPTIPGSEIRGAIRAVYEAATDSCLSVLRDSTDFPFSQRLPSTNGFKDHGLLGYDPNTKQWTLYAATMVDNITLTENNYYTIMHSGRVKWNGKDYMNGQHTHLNADGPIGWLQFNQPVTAPRNGCRVGAAYYVRLLAPKPGRSEIFHWQDDTPFRDLCYVLQESAKNDAKNKAHADLLQALQSVKSCDPKQGGLVPVWYLLADDNGTPRCYLSGASIGRVMQGRGWAEIMGSYAPCADIDALCPGCALFGTVKGKGTSGRVRFTDAAAEQYESLGNKTLPILSSPKPSAYEFYLEKPNVRDVIFWNYDFYAAAKRGAARGENPFRAYKPNARGRKFYWHSAPKTITQRSNQNSTLEAMKGVFKGSVYFDRITRERLEELAFVLTLGENKPASTRLHKLGHGKPVGYGSCKIALTGGELRTLAMQNGTLCYHTEPLPLDSLLAAHGRINTDTPSVKSLLKIVDKRSTQGKTVDYPSETRNGKGEPAIFNWFANHRRNAASLVTLPHPLDTSIEVASEVGQNRAPAFAPHRETAATLPTQENSTLHIGGVYIGRVTSLKSYGAFVDLGNRRSGLVFIKEISNRYIQSIEDELQVGQTVRVKVLDIRREGGKEKISLSIKQA